MEQAFPPSIFDRQIVLVQPEEQQPQTWAEQMDIQDEHRILGSGMDVVSSLAQTAEEESGDSDYHGTNADQT